MFCDVSMEKRYTIVQLTVYRGLCVKRNIVGKNNNI